MVGQPALAAIAGLPRICRLTLTDKSISKVLRSASKRGPSLRAALLGTKPADLRIEATVQVGGRRAKLKTTTQRIEGPGFTSVQIGISRSAAKLLRGARKAEVRASARPTDGGPVTTATRTLGR